MPRTLKIVLFTINGHAFKPSLPLLLLLSTIVNGAITYLVPLLAQVLPASSVQPIQGFALVVLNGLLIYLSTEQQQVQAAQTSEAAAPPQPPPQ
jgi:hypothetical protein